MLRARRILAGLYAQVLLAIGVGVVIGHFWPTFGAELKPLGDGFVKLVKMVIAPIIFCTVAAGVAGMDDLKQVGRVGVKALIYFEVVTTLALIIGLATVNVIKPGLGINADAAQLDASLVKSYATRVGTAQTFAELATDIIPTNAVGAFAEGNILQVLFLALLFGFALSVLGPPGKPLVALLEQCSRVLFAVVGIIMKVAPVGAFGAMAFAVGAFGVRALGGLVLLMVTFYTTCLLFIFGVLGLIARLSGFSIWRFIKYIREEVLIVLGTSSSESVLPRMIDKLERLGCSRPVVGLVIPTGYSFNLDGTSIYLTMTAVFIAQACNITLSWTEQMGILAVLLLTSKGAAAVAGGGFVTLAATLGTVSSIPVAGLSLVLGIDRFMAEARAITNLIGNGVATIVVAKWENELDETRLRTCLGAAVDAAADRTLEAAAFVAPDGSGTLDRQR